MSGQAALKLISSEPAGSISGTDPGVLSNIYDPDINLVRWRRTPGLAIRRYTMALEASPPVFQTLQAVIETRNIGQWLGTRLPEHPGQSSLIDDIVEVAEMFALLFDLDKVGLRLALLHRAMCPRFHVDHVPCRLLTSYSGAATEWLPNPLANRLKLGKGSRGLSDSQSGIYRSNHHIHRLDTGDIALLKGESWLGNEGRGLVHRSPASTNGDKRLLLSIDFA
ncbi:MAG: DUF1826 domain-containing protein [Gammaproteobacteria bacterium]|nr:MAG: DUF1826 domain-containing protein [Gammaproteobacteria bacterium]